MNFIEIGLNYIQVLAIKVNECFKLNRGIAIVVALLPFLKT